MKAFVVLALCVAVARAGVVGVAPAYGIGVGIAETGASQVSRVENGLGSYAFGYDEAHTSGGSFHKESGSPGVKVGSYGLTGADGRVRVVNYVADALGFRADVKTNEPGVGAQDPAATLINKAGVVAAAAPVLAAPAVASYAAPIAAGIAAPVVGTYGAAITHGGVVAAPAYAGIAAPVVGGYSAITHGGVVAPGIAGLGYAAGLGLHAGVPGHVTKVGHGAALLGAKIF